MKATELMIGDIVYITPDKTGRVCTVNRSNTGSSFVLVKDERYTHSLVNVTPIPLTTEILEKNGFKGEDYLILELDEFSYLEYYPFEGRLRKIWHGIDEWNNHSDTKDITFQYHCKYVHELQHALRVCEMNELADNFKI